MAGSASSRHDLLTFPRLSAWLALILVLTVALPYSAVQTLHGRRLRHADERALQIAARLQARLTSGTPMPAGPMILAGPGDRPRADDQLWLSAGTLPLARLLSDAPVPTDPWGNAYLINLAPDAQRGGPLWVISAGPDGVLQTPVSGGDLQPAGDDRAARIR